MFRSRGRLLHGIGRSRQICTAREEPGIRSEYERYFLRLEAGALAVDCLDLARHRTIQRGTRCPRGAGGRKASIPLIGSAFRRAAAWLAGMGICDAARAAPGPAIPSLPAHATF